MDQLRNVLRVIDKAYTVPQRALDSEPGSGHGDICNKHNGQNEWL